MAAKPPQNRYKHLVLSTHRPGDTDTLIEDNQYWSSRRERFARIATRQI
jgi:hypothetical protein